MNEIYLGVDIGGTAVKLGLIDSDGRILARKEAGVAGDGYRTPIIDSVIRAASEFLENSEYPAPSGIGVSATGQIDSDRRVVAGTCGNLPGWEGTPVGSRLEDAFSLPVTVANDANCMCLGEMWTGAARGESDVIGVTLGTGVGGGIISGGRLLEGFRGLGGEIGHILIHAGDGVLCTCGLRGCWEQYAATTALVRRARAVDAAFTDGRAVFTAASSGDEQMKVLLDDWIREIAAGLIGLVHIFNPKIILVGGGVSSQEELLIRPLSEAVKKGVMPAFAENLTICSASLKNDAGIVGAVKYYLSRQ